MQINKKSAAYILAFTFVCAVAFVYLLIAIAMAPYWQTLSGADIQAWWSGPFTRFSYLMVPVHLLSILTTIYAYTVHRKDEKPFNQLWLLALIMLLICQVFNFTLHGSVYNPALQSGILEEAEALSTFDNWDFYHTIRTAAVCISLLALIIIGAYNKKF